MATWYWVGGAGTWNNTTLTHWATSSGGAGGAGYPLITDNVVFDSNSGGTFTVTCNQTGQNNCANFTISAGAITFSNVGTLIVSGNMTVTAAAAFNIASVTFNSTTSQTVQNGGSTFSATTPIVFNGVGGSWALQDNLTVLSSITQTNGTLNLNGKTLSTPSYITATGTKNLTLNGGTLLCSGSGATVFNNAAPTGYTTTLGTGSGKISLNSASAKTFVGGGFTYTVPVSNDGAGALTITGANTFATLANGVSPTTFTFPASTTTTLTTSFAIAGTSGNLVTLNSSTAGTQATISLTGGATSNYLSAQDIAFAPVPTSNGTTPYVWFLNTNSTNVSNVTGALFTAPGTVAYLLTSGTSWTVPANFNPWNNTIHMIAGGGAGGSLSFGVMSLACSAGSRIRCPSISSAAYSLPISSGKATRRPAASTHFSSWPFGRFCHISFGTSVLPWRP